MSPGLRGSPLSKELLKTSVEKMQRANSIDLSGVRDLVRAVQAAVRTLNVEGNWSGKGYPEKELAEKFGAAVKDVFDALLEGKIEDPLSLAPVLARYRADLEPQVVESIRVHVLGYIRGNLKDALQEGREIHPNIFTMELGSKARPDQNELSPDELVRLEHLRAAYIMAFTMQYLEHEALIMNRKLPKKIQEMDLSIIRLAARYQSVDDIKLLLNPVKFAAYLNERGIPWTPADVQNNFNDSDYSNVFYGNRNVMESSYRFAYAIYILQHPDTLIEKLVSQGKDKGEIRTLFTLRSAQHKIARFSLFGEHTPDDAIERTVIVMLDAIHTFDNPAEFAIFINACLRKRKDDPGIIVRDDQVYEIVTKNELYSMAVNVCTVAGMKNTLEAFLVGTRFKVVSRLNQGHLLQRLQEL